ncbi:MAG: heavy-metal-associated domain-containing protein [Gammaproteobacteria bacterium]|nr:heavy-metal-associated domain-containing protein [Gammaproteobacteria bacterium]
MDTLNLKASNVKCGGCVSNIENGLQDVEGIDAVSVTIDGGKVSITGTNLNRDAISNKLIELGYPEQGYPENAK